MNWLCVWDLALAVAFGVGWSLTLWRWRSCARALHQCQAQRAKLEWKLSIYRKQCERFIVQ